VSNIVVTIGPQAARALPGSLMNATIFDNNRSIETGALFRRTSYVTGPWGSVPYPAFHEPTTSDVPAQGWRLIPSDVVEAIAPQGVRSQSAGGPSP
jgi:hypothetical protein